MPLRGSNKGGQVRAIAYKARRKVTGNTHIQSILFSKKNFHNTAQVKRKLQEMEKHSKKIETKPTWNWIRARQENPKNFKTDTFRTIKLGTGIKAVIGKKK